MYLLICNTNIEKYHCYQTLIFTSKWKETLSTHVKIKINKNLIIIWTYTWSIFVLITNLNLVAIELYGIFWKSYFVNTVMKSQESIILFFVLMNCCKFKRKENVSIVFHLVFYIKIPIASLTWFLRKLISIQIWSFIGNWLVLPYYKSKNAQNWASKYIIKAIYDCISGDNSLL